MCPGRTGHEYLTTFMLVKVQEEAIASRAKVRDGCHLLKGSGDYELLSMTLKFIIGVMYMA